MGQIITDAVCLSIFHSHRGFSPVTSWLFMKTWNRFNGLLYRSVDEGAGKPLKRLKETGEALAPPG
jgi:hypothetical protein